MHGARSNGEWGNDDARTSAATDDPEVLYTTERSRFAPTFYACSFSFVKYLADQVGLNELINLFAFGPADMNARLDRLGGKKLSEWRAEWLRLLNLG